MAHDAWVEPVADRPEIELLPRPPFDTMGFLNAYAKENWDEVQRMFNPPAFVSQDGPWRLRRVLSDFLLAYQQAIGQRSAGPQDAP